MFASRATPGSGLRRRGVRFAVGRGAAIDNDNIILLKWSLDRESKKCAVVAIQLE